MHACKALLGSARTGGPLHRPECRLLSPPGCLRTRLGIPLSFPCRNIAAGATEGEGPRAAGGPASWNSGVAQPADSEHAAVSSSSSDSSRRDARLGLIIIATFAAAAGPARRVCTPGILPVRTRLSMHRGHRAQLRRYTPGRQSAGNPPGLTPSDRSLARPL